MPLRAAMHRPAAAMGGASQVLTSLPLCCRWAIDIAGANGGPSSGGIPSAESRAGSVAVAGASPQPGTG